MWHGPRRFFVSNGRCSYDTCLGMYTIARSHSMHTTRVEKSTPLPTPQPQPNSCRTDAGPTTALPHPLAMEAMLAPPTPPVLSRVRQWVHETFICSDPKAQVEEEAPAEFTCAIYFDLLTRPLALPRCGHRFCRLCVLMLEAHLDDMVHQPWHAPPPPPFRCPRCRAEIEMTYMLNPQSIRPWPR